MALIRGSGVDERLLHQEGLLSRYQFWFAAAISAQTAAILLKRWSRTLQVASGAPAPAEL
jgi:hypothetical protein